MVPTAGHVVVMNPAKRRKINESYSSLSKPFRSPLKASAPSPKTSHEKPSNLDQQDDDNDQGDNSVISIAKGTTETHDEPRTTNATPVHSSSQQQDFINLTQRLRGLRQDLDTAKQALHLSQSKEQQDLEAAIATWRNVARDAADDVFSSSASRIHDMGGLIAWHKTTQELGGDQFNNQEDRDETAQEVGDHALHSEAYRTDHVQQFFTMDLMLRQMNIDPDVLGFDVESQSWK